MNTETIIEIIKATSHTVDSLIAQIAWFFAIRAAAHWLSVSLPLILIGSVFFRLASTEKSLGNIQKAGTFILAAWVMIGASLYTGVNGMAPLLQAAVSPSIFVATEASDLSHLISSLKKGQ
jgi:hypothetical protein